MLNSCHNFFNSFLQGFFHVVFQKTRYRWDQIRQTRASIIPASRADMLLQKPPGQYSLIRLPPDSSTMATTKVSLGCKSSKVVFKPTQNLCPLFTLHTSFQRLAKVAILFHGAKRRWDTCLCYAWEACESFASYPWVKLTPWRDLKLCSHLCQYLVLRLCLVGKRKRPPLTHVALEHLNELISGLWRAMRLGTCCKIDKSKQTVQILTVFMVTCSFGIFLFKAAVGKVPKTCKKLTE